MSDEFWKMRHVYAQMNRAASSQATPGTDAANTKKTTSTAHASTERELFVALIEEGPGTAEYLHITNAPGFSCIPAWFSPDFAERYLTRKGIKGKPVVLTRAAYKRTLKSHQDVGAELFIKLQLNEGDV